MTRNQIAVQFKISSETVRYYESLGLMAPKRDTSSGYRIYDSNDVERLRFIIMLKKFGYKLKDIKKLFQLINAGVKDKAELNHLLTDQITRIENQMSDLQSVLNMLINFRDKKDVESCSLFSRLLNTP